MTMLWRCRKHPMLLIQVEMGTAPVCPRDSACKRFEPVQPKGDGPVLV